jgi:hypothetical protein
MPWTHAPPAHACTSNHAQTASGGALARQRDVGCNHSQGKGGARGAVGPNLSARRSMSAWVPGPPGSVAGGRVAVLPPATARGALGEMVAPLVPAVELAVAEAEERPAAAAGLGSVLTAALAGADCPVWDGGDVDGAPAAAGAVGCCCCCCSCCCCCCEHDGCALSKVLARLAAGGSEGRALGAAAQLTFLPSSLPAANAAAPGSGRFRYATAGGAEVSSRWAAYRSRSVEALPLGPVSTVPLSAVRHTWASDGRAKCTHAPPSNRCTSKVDPLPSRAW